MAWGRRERRVGLGGEVGAQCWLVRTDRGPRVICLKRKFERGCSSRLRAAGQAGEAVARIQGLGWTKQELGSTRRRNRLLQPTERPSGLHRCTDVSEKYLGCCCLGV